MGVTYLADGVLAADLDMAQLELSLGDWLQSRQAELATGTYGPLRVDWVTGALPDGSQIAQLIVVDSDHLEELRVHVRVRGGSGSARVERRSTRATEARRDPVDPPPQFAAKWFSPEDTEPQLPRVLVSVDVEPSQAQLELLETLREFTPGMARVVSAGEDQVAPIAAANRVLCDGRPGTVAMLAEAINTTPVMVIPSTVALRSPDAAARRLLQRLVTVVSLSMSAQWVGVERALQTRPDTGVEEVLQQLAKDEDTRLEERQELLAEIQQLHAQTTELYVQLAEDAEDVDRLKSQVRFFEKEFAQLNVYPIGTPADDELELLPDSVAQALEIAKDALPNILVTASLDLAASLDRHDGALNWARRLWTLLRGLNDYAQLSARGDFQGGLFQYCKDAPPGSVQLPPGKVALQESEPTTNDSKCRLARTFRVPASISSDGKSVMLAHLKLSNEAPAPRAHFLDASAEIGKVIIGYVGPHLPTAG